MPNRDEHPAEFTLAFGGKALKQNTMDVRDLAPALIAFGELFTRANTILNGKDISVSLKVRATQPGSFELLLLLANIYHTTTQFLSGDMITSANNLLTLVAGAPKVGISLFRVFKKLKGQKPTVIEQKDGVTLKAKELELFIPTEVFKLYQDSEVKRLAQAVVEPLYREGIEKMVIKEGKKELETICKDDAPSFISTDIPIDGGTENINPKVYLRVTNPNLDKLKNKKWKFDDGSGIRWYKMEDPNFLQRLKEHKLRFGVDDYLVCRVRTTQHVSESKLEITREILVVMDHIVAGEQMPFKNI